MSKVLREVSARILAMEAQEPPRLPEEELRVYVDGFFRKRELFLDAWYRAERRPVYVFDPERLHCRARQFQDAFRAHLPNCGFFYAVKSNNHPGIVRPLLDCGYGLDVSSGVELDVALNADAREIVFSGPGKTEAELRLAAANSQHVTVLMDSFGEMERLAAIAETAGHSVRTGVRVTPVNHGGWNKFGIPLDSLDAFWAASRRHAGITLAGIQFHSSWNMTPAAQIETIQAIGERIAAWPEEWLSSIEFIDIGGGFWPEAGEWLLPESTAGGKINAMLGKQDWDRATHLRYPATPLVEFGKCLAEALRKHILSKTPCRVCIEPGRWVSNEAMHLLISVVDRKAEDLVITDAGTNAVGWERFEYYYAPVLNLTDPAMREVPCRIFGSLCTPHDVWGYAFWGDGIAPGDVLLIPNQGAYTYSLRQQFIKPVPDVLHLT